MLKSLRIHNLILVDHAELSFVPGFNVLTGETGAGKSAVITALSLLLGARADSQSLRKGSKKGLVEAVFDIDTNHEVLEILHEAGIEHDPQEDLILRRELSSQAKSCSFINNQRAHLVLLRQIGNILVHRVAPSASQDLRKLENQRKTLDVFGQLTDQVQAFSEQWSAYSLLLKRLEDWRASEAQRLRDIDNYRRDLEEIEEAYLSEEEESTLEIEWKRLSQADTLLSLMKELDCVLSFGEQSILSRLNQQRGTFTQLQQIDPNLQEQKEAFESAYLELHEVACFLQGAQNQLAADPEHLSILDEKLHAFRRLERKFGPERIDIQRYRENCEVQLTALEEGDMRCEEWLQELAALEKHCGALAQQLSDARKACATKLSQAVTAQLQALNMSQAQFEVRVTPGKRCAQGDDKVEFFLSPNLGEAQVSVQEHISGGESARVLLALKTLLAGKEHTGTLIFDELDAHIGGQTAVVVGKKLLEIAQSHQVIAITHFPQLAQQAEGHIAIAKKTIEGRTVSMLRCPAPHEREDELARMRGELCRTS